MYRLSIDLRYTQADAVQTCGKFWDTHSMTQLGQTFLGFFPFQSLEDFWSAAAVSVLFTCRKLIKFSCKVFFLNKNLLNFF